MRIETSKEEVLSRLNKNIIFQKYLQKNEIHLYSSGMSNRNACF